MYIIIMVYSEVVHYNIQLQCMGENVSAKASKYFITYLMAEGSVKLIFFYT